MRLHQSSAVWLAGLVLAAMPLAAGEPQSGGDRQDLASLDLEKLLNMKVTTASKFAESLRDAPGVMSVVTRDEIRRFGATTLEEVLNRVPGLTGTGAYFSDAKLVAARGDQTRINGGHILVLINGRPTRETLEGGVIGDLLESFPVAILDRIEVIRGPGSVLYGSNAFSAVINLITIKADGDGFAMTALPGTGGARSGSGQGTLKFGDLGIVGGVQLHQASGWTTPYQSVPLVPGAMPWVNARIQDQGAGGYLGLNYKGLSFMSSVTGLDSTSFVGDVIGQPRMCRGFADLGYSFKASRIWEMSFNATYTRNLRTVYEFPSAHRDGYELLGEWTNFVRPTERDEFTFGTLFDYTQGVELPIGSGDAITDASRPGGGLYAQWDHRLLKNLKLLGGLQANKIGSISLDVVPRAGVLWSPWSPFTIKALYGEAFRAPSLNEIGMNYPGGLQGNPNLKPEKVKTFDLAGSYQSKRVQAEIGYFHSDQNQSITLVNDAAGVRWVNLGATTFNGVEAEGKYYLKKNFLLMGSALYQANSDQSGASNVTPIPNYQLKGGISYEAEHGLTASLFDSYQGPLDQKYDGALNPSPSSYHLLSSHFRYDLSRYFGLDNRKGLALVAHAENLANRQVWLPAWGEGMGSTMPVYRGRTVYFGIEVWFRRE